MERLTSRLDTDEKRIKELKDVQEELLKEQQREQWKQKTIRTAWDGAAFGAYYNPASRVRIVPIWFS